MYDMPRKQTVLVVEDHPFQRRALVRVLQAMAIPRVLEAVDGCQALALLAAATDPIDTVITDLDMPTLDGIALMRQIGEHAPDADIVLLSAVESHLLAAVEWLAREQGINLAAVLEKPVSARALQAALHRRAPARLAAAPVLPVISVEDIAEGLSAGQFEAFLQPQIRLKDGQLEGAEALARWRHPRFGLLSPAAFVAVIEGTPLIEAFSLAILESAAWAVRWLDEAKLPGRIAINVPAAWLDRPAMAERLSAAIARLRLPIERLTIEVTESAAIGDLRAAHENLARLRLRGFTLSIDDFGTGFSSLERLVRAPFSELKLDRSFVSSIERNSPRWFVVESTVALARKLGMKTVAEGVETQTEWRMMQELGCDSAQGYFVARPMERHDFERWAAEYGRSHWEAEQGAEALLAH